MLFYIGRFPPPYGGVTVKNELLYKKINNKIRSIKKIDTNNLKISKVKANFFFFSAIV